MSTFYYNNYEYVYCSSGILAADDVRVWLQQAGK